MPVDRRSSSPSRSSTCHHRPARPARRPAREALWRCCDEPRSCTTPPAPARRRVAHHLGDRSSIVVAVAWVIVTLARRGDRGRRRAARHVRRRAAGTSSSTPRSGGALRRGLLGTRCRWRPSPRCSRSSSACSSRCSARSRIAVVRIPTTIVLEFFRGMPVLLMMLFILLVFSTGSFWAVVAALAVYNGALIGEALRAGIAVVAARASAKPAWPSGSPRLQTRLADRVPAGLPHRCCRSSSPSSWCC